MRRITSLVPTLNPAYGGPAVSALSIADALNEIGIDHQLVTLDAPDAPWLKACETPVIALGPAHGRYRYAPTLERWLEAQARATDGFIVHGIWQHQSLAARRVLGRLGRPYLLFVHGALDPWFKRAFPLKHVKKWVYWQLFERSAIRQAKAVLYTAEAERDLAQQSFGAFPGRHVVVPHGVAEPPANRDAQLHAFRRRFPNLEGKRLVVFLGRLHEKKGCDLLLRALSAVAPAHPELHLVIAGPDDGAYAEKLRALSSTLNLQARITWTGLLTGDEKWGALRAAEVFALPSHSENFGIALVEALACSCPVLITPKVNIWPAIEREHAGLVCADTEEGTRVALETWLGLTSVERSAMARRARRCYEQNFSMSHMVRVLISLFDAPAESSA